MPNLLRARSWGRVKPPPGVPLDGGHLLSRGLVFGTTFAGPTGSQSDITGRWSPSYTPVPHVLGQDVAGTSGNSLAVSSFTSLSSFTFVLGLKHNTVASNDGVMLIEFAGSSGATEWGFYHFSDGNFYFDTGTTPQRASLAASAFYNTAQRVQIAGVLTASGLQAIYANGIKRASTSGSPITAGTANTLRIGWGVLNPLKSVIEYAYVWNRGLMPNEMARVYAEPYAMFTPPGPKVLYFGPFSVETPTPPVTTVHKHLTLGRRKAVSPRNPSIRRSTGVSS